MLKETINSQAFTQGLANHFGTKASIKNMLSGKKNMRTIQPLFEDTNYAEEILEYGNIREVLTGILDDVFKEYIRVFNKKLPEGELGNTKDRVQMFIGLFDERLNKEPEGGIISSFADFAKSATGKKIAKVLKDSGNESNEDLMDVIAYIAIRSVIINADKLVEPSVLVEETQESESIEVEVVTLPENHPYTKTDAIGSKAKELIDPIIELVPLVQQKVEEKEEKSDVEIRKKTMKKFRPNVESFAHSSAEVKPEVSSTTVDELIDMVTNISKYSINDIDRIISKLYKTFLSNNGKIISHFKNYTPQNRATASTIRLLVEDMLPINRISSIGDIPIINIIALVTDDYDDNFRDSNMQKAARAIAIFLSYSIMDLMLHISNEESYNRNLKNIAYVLKYSASGDDMSLIKPLGELKRLVKKVNSEIETTVNKRSDLPPILAGCFGLGEQIAKSVPHVATNTVVEDIYRWVENNF